jgi:oligosaccharide repeat unit polymerase
MWILAIGARIHTRSWTHPATLFPLVWALHTLVPLVFAPELPIYSSGLWYIAMMCFAVLGGALLPGDQRSASSNQVPAAQLYDYLRSNALRPLSIVALCSLPVGMLYCYLTLAPPGQSAGNLLSIEAIAKLASANSVLRYTYTNYRPNLFTQFISSAVYFGPTLGGIIYALRRTKYDTLLSCTTFIPAICVAVTQTTKASVLLSGVFWLATYIACTEYTGRRPAATRVLAGAVLSLILLACLLGAAEALRGGDVPTIEAMSDALSSERMQAMLIGDTVAFSHWFERSLGSDTQATYGTLTFAGPADLLGLQFREAGVYIEAVDVGVQGSESNVYTYVRGLIQDFTPFGALLVLYVAGVVAGWAYRAAQAQKLAAITFLSVFHAFSIWYLISIFSYNSLIVALTGLAVCWSLAIRGYRSHLGMGIAGTTRV